MRKTNLVLAVLFVVSMFLLSGCGKKNYFFSQSPLVVQSANIFIPYGEATNGKTAIIVVTTQEGVTILIQSYDPSEKLTKLISSIRNGDKIHVQGSFHSVGFWKCTKISEIINLTSGMIYKEP